MTNLMLFDFQKKDSILFYKKQDSYKCYSIIKGPIEESFDTLSFIDKIDRSLEVLFLLDCLKTQSIFFIWKNSTNFDDFFQNISNIKNLLDKNHFQSNFINETNLEKNFFFFLENIENSNYYLQIHSRKYPFLLFDLKAKKTSIFIRISNIFSGFDKRRILNIILFFCTIKKPFFFCINHVDLKEFYISNFCIVDDEQFIGKIENFVSQNAFSKSNIGLKKISFKDFKHILKKQNLSHYIPLPCRTFKQFLEIFNNLDNIEFPSAKNDDITEPKIRILQCIEKYSHKYRIISPNEIEIGLDIRIFFFTMSDKIQYINHFIEKHYSNYQKLIIICEKDDMLKILQTNIQMERTKKIRLIKIDDLSPLEQILNNNFKIPEILV